MYFWFFILFNFFKFYIFSGVSTSSNFFVVFLFNKIGNVSFESNSLLSLFRYFSVQTHKYNDDENKQKENLVFDINHFQ